jgi:type II secretory ATPase GspE/PulE/Tfp pilus assembly ATPase PilB-like protein
MVPVRYLPVLRVVSLLVGPLVAAAVLVSESSKSKEQGSPLARLFRQASKSFTKAVRRGGQSDADQEPKLQLFDSLGTDLQEIYGHGQKADKHVFNLTIQMIDNALMQRASDILIDPKDQTACASTAPCERCGRSRPTRAGR